jgi:hypothetical protein
VFFTGLEKLINDKHSNLLQKSVNYGHFITLGPGVIFEGKAWNIPLSGASERLRPCRQTLD